MTPKQFGRKLRSLRLQSKLTQQQLADKLDADKSYISKLENGRAEYAPKRWMFKELSLIFGVTESKLMLLCGVVPDAVTKATGKKLSNAIVQAEKQNKSVRVEISIDVEPDGSIELLE